MGNIASGVLNALPIRRNEEAGECYVEVQVSQSQPERSGLVLLLRGLDGAGLYVPLELRTQG